MKRLKFTRKIHEHELNEIFVNSDQYIMGGKLRSYYMLNNLYGSCLRKFDPIAFEVSFQENYRLYK